MLSAVTGVNDRDSSREVAVGVLTALGVLWVVAFVAVWLGSWSIRPGRYANARAWWVHYAFPRAGWSLLVGVPVAIATGLLVVHLIRRSRTGNAPPAKAR